MPGLHQQRRRTGYNDLATTHPDIAKGLDPVLNGATTAQTIQAAARRSLAWRCPRNRHVYWATASNRTQGGTNCGICSNRTIVPGINDLTTTHPRLAAELNPAYEAGHPATKMCAGSGDKPEWICPDCGHRYKMSLYNRSQGSGCEPCRRARLRRERTSLADTHPDIAAQWYPTRNNGKQPEDYSPGSNDTVYWLCATGAAHWYPQRIDRKVQGYGCSVCSRRRLVLRVNDLATTNPLLVTEWHDYLNVPKRPEFMLAGPTGTGGSAPSDTSSNRASRTVGSHAAAPTANPKIGSSIEAARHQQREWSSPNESGFEHPATHQGPEDETKQGSTAPTSSTPLRQREAGSRCWTQDTCRSRGRAGASYRY